MADPKTTIDRTRGSLEHVEWLAREKRHTTYDDPWTTFAVQHGWVTQAPGIMPDARMFRVELTDAGRDAVKAILHAE